MDNSTVDSMCRCCAAEGIFKDIKTSYHWMGEEEVYGDMLRECFDVKLATIEEGGICEVCITQLRNAVNFKKQVLHTEKKFKRHLENQRFKPAEVKEELSGDNGNSSDDNDNGGADSEDDEDYVPEFEIPIKTESLEEAKSRKRSAKATTSRAKKSKHDDGDKNVLSSSDEDEPLAAEKSVTLFRKVNFSSFISIPPGGTPESTKISQKKKKLPQKVQKRRSTDTVEEKPFEKVEQKRTLTKRKSTSSKRKAPSEQRVKIPNPNPKTRLTEMDWHLDNIRTILNCSNATPIHAKEDGGHSCSYCFQKFTKLTELKKHCFSNHKKGKPDFLKMRPGKILSKHIVYLDITSLKCRVCRADIDSLEMLMEHLQNAHDETMHLVIKNQIMPLRVVDERLRCAVCAIEVDFDKIADHMSQHYRNYVCEFCDASFVIRCKMLEHKKNVHDV